MIHYDIFTNNKKKSLEILCFISFWGFYCTLLYSSWNIAKHIPIILLKKKNTYLTCTRFFSDTNSTHCWFVNNIPKWFFAFLFRNNFYCEFIQHLTYWSIWKITFILIKNRKMNLFVVELNLNFRQKRHWGDVNSKKKNGHDLSVQKNECVKKH